LAVAPLGLALFLGCTGDDAALAPPEQPDVDAPSGVFLDEASGTSVVLRWSFEGESQTGFRIERWIGRAGDPEVVAEPAATDREFRDDLSGLEDEAVFYRVRTAFGSLLSEPSPAVSVTLALDAPTSPFLLSEADTIRLSWFTPDFEFFDGFRLSRVLGDETLHSSFEITWFEPSIDPLVYEDGSFPLGSAPGDRMRYIISTRSADLYSRPVELGRVEWTLPLYDGIALTGPAEHDAARMAYMTDTHHVIRVTETAGGGTKLAAMVRDYPTFRIRAQVEATNVRLGGTVPDENHVVVASRATGSDAVTLTTHRFGSGDTLWAHEAASGVADVWNAPESGEIAFFEAGACRVADPLTGADVHVLPCENAPRAIAFPAPAGATYAVAEARDGVSGAESRTVLRSYPDGAVAWAGEWVAGSALEGHGGLVVAGSGDLFAMTVDAGAGSEFHVFGPAGARIGGGEGRAIDFTPDRALLFVLDEGERRPRAYAISADDVVGQEAFGGAATTAAFLMPEHELLWTLHGEGIFRMRAYGITRRWEKIFGAAKADEFDTPRRVYRIIELS
jgi:hypothetical protein